MCWLLLWCRLCLRLCLQGGRVLQLGFWHWLVLRLPQVASDASQCVRHPRGQALQLRSVCGDAGDGTGMEVIGEVGTVAGGRCGASHCVWFVLWNGGNAGVAYELALPRFQAQSSLCALPCPNIARCASTCLSRQADQQGLASGAGFIAGA